METTDSVHNMKASESNDARETSEESLIEVLVRLSEREKAFLEAREEQGYSGYRDAKDGIMNRHRRALQAINNLIRVLKVTEIDYIG